MTPDALVIAGQPIPDAGRLVADYCGVTGEVWAYRYYDQIPLDDGEPSRLDLLTAAIMHGPLRRADLQWFEDRRAAIADLLADLPGDVDLADAPTATIDQIAEGIDRLADGHDGATRGLLTKIVHRRRPRLAAIDERDIAKRYARAAGQGGRLPYRDLLAAMATDLADRANATVLDRLTDGLNAAGLNPLPTALRTLDIVVWMHATTTR